MARHSNRRGTKMRTKPSSRGSGSRRRPVRPLAATAAVIGGAGLILGAPAAALLAAPGVSYAAPLAPVPLQAGALDFFGSAGLDGIFDVFGAIPILNIFIGNGADGTATSPNGGARGCSSAAAVTASLRPLPAPAVATVGTRGSSSVTAVSAATVPPEPGAAAGGPGLNGAAWRQGW